MKYTFLYNGYILKGNILAEWYVAYSYPFFFLIHLRHPWRQRTTCWTLPVQFASTPFISVRRLMSNEVSICCLDNVLSWTKLSQYGRYDQRTFLQKEVQIIFFLFLVVLVVIFILLHFDYKENASFFKIAGKQVRN